MCRNLLISLAIVILLNSSCIEKYDIQLSSITPKMVVEANITNENGPYFVRLTKSRSKLTNDPYNSPETDSSFFHLDVSEPIEDAEVYITDNSSGIIDTLRKAPSGTWHHFVDTIYHREWDYFTVPDTTILLGYYLTDKLKGIAGHTYSLKIVWQGKEYHSISYMPPVPSIDSVHFVFTKGDIGKDDYYIPLLYFEQPKNERNYYLFVTQGNNFVWPYSILSGEYLNEYVNGLDVFKGASVEYWMTAYPDISNDYFIEMHSLTEEGYQFYKALLQQFRNDGGMYSPSPGSPVGNIDNGALGFFKVSAVNRLNFKIRIKK